MPGPCSGKILVTDYIKKRRGQALLFSFEYNLLIKISDFNHYMDRATVPLCECSRFLGIIHLCNSTVCIIMISAIDDSKSWFYHSVLLNCRFILMYAPASSGKFV
jgi:hypothetical protein